MINKRFFNVNELVEYLGVKPDTIYRWVSQKRIPYVKMGRLTKFDTLIIDKWIKENSVACKDYH